MITKLILTYQYHRNLGALLLPAIAAREENVSFYQLSPVIQETNYDDIPDLNEEKINILEKCFECTEKGIFQFFGRRSTNQTTFFQNLDADFCKNHIRPYIEKRILEIVKIAQNQDVHIYIKNSNNVFEGDKLKVLKNEVKCSYHFNYENNALQYELKLYDEDREIALRNQKIHIVCEKPALFIINNTLCFIKSFNSKQIIPFVSKNFISIPEKMVDQYFNTFVKKTLENHTVTANGFSIETIKPEALTKLTLEQGFNSQFVLNLEFNYDKLALRSDSKKIKATVFFDATTKSFQKIERNASKEREIIAFLSELNLVNKTGTQYGIKGGSNNADLITWINTNAKILAENNIFVQNITETDYFLGSIVLKIETTESIDWFDVRATVSFGDYSIPFVKLRNHLIRGNREYKLPDNKIAIIPEEWFSKYEGLFGKGIIEGDRIRVQKYQFDVLQNLNTDITKNIVNRFESLITQQNHELVPNEINAELRNYQTEGYNWMRKLHEFKFGGCLADDMGLGKTLQTIAMLTHHHLHTKQNDTLSRPKLNNNQQLSLFDNNETNINKGTSLIIAPSSLVHNWVNEIKKFAPALKITTHTGGQRRQNTGYFAQYDIIISSLGTVRNDIEMLKLFKFEYIVIDESQTIKNPTSQAYEAIIQLQSTHKLVLTGTPIENSLQDLWAQLNFVNPGLLGSLRYFKKQYVTPIEKQHDEKALEKLKKLTAPFILRRKKSDVAKDLPSLTEQTIMCEMTDEQTKKYDKQKSMARNALLNIFSSKTIGNHTTIVLNSLNTLRQIANSPALIDESYNEESGKTEIVTRHLENIVAEQHKVLVFSSYVKHLDLYEKICKNNQWGYTKLTGNVPQKERESLVDKFQTDENTNIFLISLKAGGVGLNLTAADYVMILDPWWNPAAEAQAVNRAHRIGQTNNVMVYRYISENTIEEKIQTLQSKKQKLSNELIDDKVALADLTMDDIKALFE